MRCYLLLQMTIFSCSCIFSVSGLAGLVENNTVSALYTVQLDIGVTKLEDVNSIERSLNSLIIHALVAADADHLQMKTAPFNDIPTTNSNVTVQVTRVFSVSDRTTVYFVVYKNGIAIPGQVIAKDISLLSVSHISALLQYPVLRIMSQKDVDVENQSQWWIIGIIFGAGLFILILGWLILFTYYNSCGLPTVPYKVSKTVYLRDDGTQYEVNKSEDLTQNAWNLVKQSSIQQFSSNALELEESTKITGKDNESAVGENERREPEIGPPNDVMEDTPQIIQELEDRRFRNTRIRPTPLVFGHEMSEVSGSVSTKNHIESDSDASPERHIDQKSQDDLRIPTRKQQRPRTAGKTRPIRNVQGDIIAVSESNRKWDEYLAADTLATVYPNDNSTVVSFYAASDPYPRPSQPTQEGAICVKESSQIQQQSNSLDVL